MTCSWRMVTCFPSGRTVLQLLCLQLCVPLCTAEYHAWRVPAQCLLRAKTGPHLSCSGPASMGADLMALLGRRTVRYLERSLRSYASQASLAHSCQHIILGKQAGRTRAQPAQRCSPLQHRSLLTGRCSLMRAEAPYCQRRPASDMPSPKNAIYVGGAIAG